MVRSLDSEARTASGSQILSISAFHLLCDLEQVTQPLNFHFTLSENETNSPAPTFRAL